ncbi:uncharacterized protein LACBIDRAFT_302634 [Laccaria bicolor S238N-H82]|uniref:Predicted protein n=1 Tax=Laccaria bicolor (strain S238N-H82 / ATCC MYA-4686) TaxID=486041 RepID=B0DI16_LACBS|nr:uncharacterized protein LACBIDRAFT_302634 [Laccaria bicolor S238N-H82]EDR05828.1 predicted protein [Laccaria bicolor S238N-H82]|eukprot:XP_001883504.1 predicted protein [Laccaria bicolor S238N-H82]
MDRAQGRHPRDLKGILGSMSRIKEFLKYVGRTERLKASLGDTIGELSRGARTSDAQSMPSRRVRPQKTPPFLYPHLSLRTSSTLNHISLGKHATWTLKQTATRLKTISFPERARPVKLYLLHCDRVLGRRNVLRTDCIDKRRDETTPLTIEMGSQTAFSCRAVWGIGRHGRAFTSAGDSHRGQEYGIRGLR